MIATSLTVVLLSLFSTVFTQTDWLGGSGSVGPVGNWEDSFECSTGIDWAAEQGKISLVQNTSVPEVITSDLDSPACMGAADIDGDGDTDVVCAGFLANKLVWFEHNEPSGWTMHDVDVNVPSCCATCVLDMNGDDFPDIINASEVTGVISWYENNGTGTHWNRS